MNTRTDLIPGTVLALRFGPFRCTAVVMEVSPLGIVVAPNDDAKLVGYKAFAEAPNGTQLTNNLMHAFIGAAHLPAVETVNP
jgi:hypothetical protein